jgi:hypothetical protein
MGMSQLLDRLHGFLDNAFGSPVVVLEDKHQPPIDHRPTLRRIAAEALIRQDEAEDVLRSIRDRVPLGHVAPRGGPLVRRFFALRDMLPEHCEDSEQERLRGMLDVILHNHAMLISTAMDLAACEWRSERISRQIDTLDGVGATGQWLDEIYAQLR